MKPKTYPPGFFSAPVLAWPGLRDYVPVMAGDTDHTEKRRAAAAKGRETALEKNVGWADGSVQMPGTPGYLAPGWMGKK